MFQSLEECIEWVSNNPEKAAETVWTALQSLPHESQAFFDRLETLSQGQLDCTSLKSIVFGHPASYTAAETISMRAQQSSTPRPSRTSSQPLSSAILSSVPAQPNASHRKALSGLASSCPVSPTLVPASTAYSRSPTPVQSLRASSSSSPRTIPAPLSQEVPAQTAFSKYIDQEVKSFIARCEMDPSDFISTNDKLSDVARIGVSALLHNVKKLQRHMRLDRIRLRMHRYVLYVLQQHIKSGLETNYAVGQYLAKVIPGEQFFPGRNDKAFAGKIDDRDAPQQGPRREHFIKTHMDAGILSVVEQLNGVAYKVCNDLWVKTVTWLNKHGDIQWRTTFPEAPNDLTDHTERTYGMTAETQPVERGRPRPSASNTTLQDGRSRAASAATYSPSIPQESAVRASSQCDPDQRPRKRFQPDLHSGQNKRASSLRRDLLLTPPSRPSTPAFQADLQEVSLDLLNGPWSTSTDMAQWPFSESTYTCQSASTNSSTLRSAYSTPLTPPSVSPGLQPTLDAGMDFFQYDNNFDVFGFNYGTVGSEQDALMSLFSEGGWMADMAQGGDCSTQGVPQTSHLEDTWATTPGIG